MRNSIFALVLGGVFWFFMIIPTSVAAETDDDLYEMQLRKYNSIHREFIRDRLKQNKYLEKQNKRLKARRKQLESEQRELQKNMNQQIADGTDDQTLEDNLYGQEQENPNKAKKLQALEDMNKQLELEYENKKKGFEDFERVVQEQQEENEKLREILTDDERSYTHRLLEFYAKEDLMLDQKINAYQKRRDEIQKEMEKLGGEGAEAQGAQVKE